MLLVTVLEEDVLMPFQGHVKPMVTAADHLSVHDRHHASPPFLLPSRCLSPDKNSWLDVWLIVDLAMMMLMRP